MLVLRTSNFQTLYCLYCSPINFLPRATSKIILSYFQFFRWKLWQPNAKFERDKRQNPAYYNSSCLFSTYMPACLQKNFHGRVLSIRVFSSGGHYGLIVSLRKNNNIASRDQFKPIKIGENLGVNGNALWLERAQPELTITHRNR